MAEYIEREAAIDRLEKLMQLQAPTARAIIEAIPAADVQPVRHGRWIMRGGKWRCSECDQKALLRLSDATGGCREYEYYRANYCPNCGAHMDMKEGKPDER